MRNEGWMRQSYDKPVPATLPATRSLTNSFSCLWVYWQPDPSAPDPDRPGLKHKVWMEMPVKGHEPCLCGSGYPFRQCCRRLPYIPTICPNPGLQGYSVLRHHSATFHVPDGAMLRQHLHDDMRLQCVEDTPTRTFWLVWGVPARESRYGIICFGDIELREEHTLLITALSPLRMHWILTFLADVLPLDRDNATMITGPIQWIDKRTGLPAPEDVSLLLDAPSSAAGKPARRPKK